MQDPNYVRDAFSRIADRYVSTNHVLSLGIDVIWRKRVAQLVEGWQPDSLLDVATGSGDLAMAIRDVLPEQTRVVGSDFCEPMLNEARRRYPGEWLVADAMDLPFKDGEFDAVTVAFGLRNMADYDRGLSEMRRVTGKGGHLLILDFSHPPGVFGQAYDYYLQKVLPKIAGALTGHADAYEYLGGSIQKFPSGQDMIELLEKNGFHEGYWEPLSGGIASIYTARVKD